MCTTPGEKALAAIKKQNDDNSRFKVPAVPGTGKKTKSKQVVLPEEQYIALLGKIIQRDFFPDLERLNAQNDYLEAVERNDITKLRELCAKYSGHRFTSIGGNRSPATFETPITSANSTPQFGATPNSYVSDTSHESEKDSTISKSHSLDSFLRSYTSEDNDSFQTIIETAKEKLEQKLIDLYKVRPPAIEAAPVSNDITPAIHEGTGGTMRSSIMFVPDGVELTPAEKLELNSRKRVVAYLNTRFSHNPFNERQNKQTITELARTQAKILTGKVGVDGNIVQNSLNENRGFDFVKTPSPAPGEACTPLMTWGEIEGTPFKLDGSDTPLRPTTGPSFRINESSRREMIALELAEKAGERMRGQKRKAIENARRNMVSPYVRMSTDRLASLSPAAKRLAADKLGLRTSLMTPTTRSQSSNTPLLVRPKATPSPLVRKKSNATPVATKEPTIDNSQVNLTDNLLHIPSSKRPKAADFF